MAAKQAVLLYIDITLFFQTISAASGSDLWPAGF